MICKKCGRKMIRIKEAGKENSYIFKCQNCGAEAGSSKQAAETQK